MKITCTVKTKSKKTGVLQKGPFAYAVCVAQPPLDGKANEALIKALSRHFGVPQSRISIVSGHTGKKKIIEIL